MRRTPVNSNDRVPPFQPPPLVTVSDKHRTNRHVRRWISVSTHRMTRFGTRGDERAPQFHERGIWIGLCVLLLLVMAGMGGFGYLQLQRARLATIRELAARAEAQKQLEAHHAATDLSADLSVKVLDLEARVGELEVENHELRQHLNGADSR